MTQAAPIAKLQVITISAALSLLQRARSLQYIHIYCCLCSLTPFLLCPLSPRASSLCASSLKSASESIHPGRKATLSTLCNSSATLAISLPPTRSEKKRRQCADVFEKKGLSMLSPVIHSAGGFVE